MPETRTRKPNRSKEEIIMEIDDKIAYHEKCIETLNPKMTAKQQLKAVLAKAQEQGISPKDIAEKLGVKL